MALIRQDARWMLIATATLCALALIASRTWSLWGERDALLIQAASQARDASIILEEYAKRTFETGDLTLNEIARYTSEKGGPAALRGSDEAHRFLNSLTLASSSGDFFLVIDAEGKPSALTSQYPPPDIVLKDQAWFQEHLQGRDRVIGEAITGRITGSLLFTYSRWLTDNDGRFAGAAQIAVLPTFLKQIASGDKSAALRLYLVRSDGVLVAGNALSPADTVPRVHFQLPSKEEEVSNFMYASAEYSASFRRLERWPIVAVAMVPKDAILATWRTNVIWNIAGLAIFSLLLLWLTKLNVGLQAREVKARLSVQAANDELSVANTALARAVQERDLLMQEMHHRIKNNLAMISSLLRLQAQRSEDLDVRRTFAQSRDRIQSIALVHEALYRASGHNQVELGAYLSSLLSCLADANGADEKGIDVEVHADEITVSTDIAIPMAMAVTEAAINAFKHAFPNERRGRILVEATVSNNLLIVAIRDNGVGKQAEPSEDSLGGKLIDMFTAQLHGTIMRESKIDGTCVRITVPSPGTAVAKTA